MSPDVLLAELAKLMVDKPDEIKVTVTESPDVVAIEVRCAESDGGKLVGTGGRYAVAMRTLVTAMYGKEKKRASLFIIDPRTEKRAAGG